MLDARYRKIVVDVVDLRVDLFASALAVALGFAVVTFWLLPTAPVAALAALVVAQGSARIGRARALERHLLRALGAMDTFVALLSGIEGACFGAIAALMGVVVSASLAAIAGSPVTLTWCVAWLAMSTLVASASAWIASRRGAEREWSA